MFIIKIGNDKLSDMHTALQRALNTWENRPEWLVELCDNLEARTPSVLDAKVAGWQLQPYQRDAMTAILEETPLPEWAESRIPDHEDGYTMLRAQLCTRDGRKCGNAVVIEVKALYGQGATPIGLQMTVMTDMGTEIALSRGEIERLFYPPKYIVKQDAVGQRLKACVNEDEAREMTAARATLLKMNYQWNGGELWKPPLGKRGFDGIDLAFIMTSEVVEAAIKLRTFADENNLKPGEWHIVGIGDMKR